jgi:Tfp pilus assembly ATPase PilU
MDAMEQGETEGMQTFDGQLEKMVREGLVTKEDALAYASNQGNLLLRLGAFGAGGSPRPKVEPKPDSMLDLIER